MRACPETPVPTHILQRLPLGTGRSTPASLLWTRLWNFLSRSGTATGADPVSMQLAAGQELRLHDAPGWTVACLRGSLWITQEADARDLFLDAGGSFALDRPGLALIFARRHTVLAIRPPARRAVTERPGAAPGPATDSAREVWLRAVYPECGPWNDPAVYRRSGLL
jgi:DUF2917 family protein